MRRECSILSCGAIQAWAELEDMQRECGVLIVAKP